MARVTDGSTTITTRAGVQPQQYVEQLRAAGFFKPLMTVARPVLRRQMEHAVNALIRDLRAGRIMPDTKEHAAKLGLRVYPD